MGSGIARASGGETAAPTGLTADTWRGIERRVTAYLNALGVSDAEEIERLRPQILQRVEAHAAVVHLGEPLEAAIAAAHLLLDRWLVSELGIEGDANALSAARAAVLGGHVPGWTARWAGLSDESLAEPIRAARILPVPELAPLVMEPNPIRLCCHRLLIRLLARLGRLLGTRGRKAAPIRGNA